MHKAKGGRSPCRSAPLLLVHTDPVPTLTPNPSCPPAILSPVGLSCPWARSKKSCCVANSTEPVLSVEELDLTLSLSPAFGRLLKLKVKSVHLKRQIA